MEEAIRFLTELDRFVGVERRYLVKKEGFTDPNYGKTPTARTLEELLKYGIVNLDKPPGPTSHEVVAWVKKILGIPKAGHGGTLEPSQGGDTLRYPVSCR
ncbi:MAG: tRNA pseudouridine synthase A [Sulfolobales archaeon]|nr:tRNA pseudouridine synthase A [Sulfolobales archaeon]MDW8082840.1 tRNA pseudouridine synthase A [Sulfolobales archaeon]